MKISLINLKEYINSNYGTYRGLIRLVLAWLEQVTGRLNVYRDIDMRRVDRLVFVCLGNVCRSPYAELIAKEKGLPSASIGLSTTTGHSAYIDAINAAKLNNRDLTKHLATNITDFEIRDSDLLLVMEVRQINQIKKFLFNSKAQISLLGLWANPSRPHIHDPMTLSNAYFLTCYSVIENAVTNLANAYHLSKTSENQKPN